MENKKYTDVMIDIETLDTKSTAVILSIAAIAFNIETHEICERNVNLSIDYKSQIDEGRTTSIETSLWWSEQSKEARRVAFAGKENLDKAIMFLNSYIIHNCNNYVRVWANSPAFDLNILNDAFGQMNLAWRYSQERDVRTLINLLPELVKALDIETTHIAIEDCRNQIIKVCAVYQDLNK